DHVGHLRRLAADFEQCDRFGIPPSARHHDHRRLDPEPGADPVHHAGGLSLSGSLAFVVGTSAQKEHRSPRCVAAGMMVARPGFVLPAGVCRFTPKGEAFNSNARSFEEIAAGATQRNCRLENRRAKGRRDSRPMAGNVCRHKFERARRAGEHFQSNGRGGVRKFSVGPRGRQTDTVRFFPTVGVSPSVTRLRTTSINSRNDLTYSEYSLPLDASWEPDFWGSIRNTYKASKLEAQATLADLENTRLTVQSGLEA